MKWTNSTLIEKLLQFLNSLIDGLEINKGKTSESLHQEKKSQIPTLHLSYSLPCNLYSGNCKDLFFLILKGVELAVSKMQKWVKPGQRK